MRFKLLSFASSIALLISSCSTDFKSGADYKDVTSAFCLLSMSDTAHYVKINKGFFSETENNLIIAQNPDSLYFKNIEVKVEELNNGNVQKTYPLNRVDLKDEGYIKDEGTFAQNPSYAYKFKFKQGEAFNPSRTYRLVITNLSTGRVIDAFTNVIDDAKFKIQFPLSGKDVISFADYEKPTPFSWNIPEGASFFDLYMRFYYEEENIASGARTREVKDLLLAKNIQIGTSNLLTSFVKSETFYGVLNAALPFKQDFVRYVDTPDIYIQAGGKELKTYIDVTTAQGGLTADQIKPNYTNFRFDGQDGTGYREVFGIFSSRAEEYVGRVPFDVKTIEELKKGKFSGNLRIVGLTSN
jgi:hypothetical protein